MLVLEIKTKKLCIFLKGRQNSGAPTFFGVIKEKGWGTRGLVPLQEYKKFFCFNLKNQHQDFDFLFF